VALLSCLPIDAPLPVAHRQTPLNTELHIRRLAIATLVAVAFAAGLLCSPDTRTPVVLADGGVPQERGQRPPIGAPVNPGSVAVPLPPEEEPPILYASDSGQAGYADGFIAVTGSYGVGTSVLYLFDTNSRQLAVYEARGGSPGTRRVVLVGARRIDLDLQLEGYNDESEFSYRELAHQFAQRKGLGRPSNTNGGSAAKPAGATESKGASPRK